MIGFPLISPGCVEFIHGWIILYLVSEPGLSKVPYDKMSVEVLNKDYKRGNHANSLLQLQNAHFYWSGISESGVKYRPRR
jgi:hypothetical protein